MNKMSRWWPAAMVAVAMAASACGGSLTGIAPHHPAPRAVGQASRAGAVVASHHRVTGSGAWPALVSRAITATPMAFAGTLAAPTTVPRGNSATVSITADTYSVALYQCPTALAINSAAIGIGSCGTQANLAEAFGATIYPTAEALQQVTAYQTPPGTPVATTLHGGVQALRWTGSASANPIEVAWQAGGWHVVVAGASALATAQAAARLLTGYGWPSAHGLLTVDTSAGALHASLQWAVGDTLYFTSASHNLAHALAMASTMKRYP